MEKSPQIFRFKKFSVVNQRSAMKVNTDGVLLGAVMTILPQDSKFLDIGTGTGTIALMTAQRHSDIVNGFCSTGLADQEGPVGTSEQSISLCSCSASCSTDSEQPDKLRLIAYCFEDENIPRRSIKEVLNSYNGTEIIVMIGPEGDFSKEEADLALASGFIPVHLGDSRLRTETAALTATAAVYLQFMQ